MSPEDFKKEASASAVVHSIGHAHMVSPHAAFQHRGSYYLLFPWADGGNLRSMWQMHPNPSFDRQLMTWAVEQAEGIASALHALHNVRRGSSNRFKCFGRHGDLKPDNILWFKSERIDTLPSGVLKLSDFGLAMFNVRQTEAWSPIRHHTRTYCAPETYRAPRLGWCHEPTQAFDVWSLGCVFLEFLTWLLSGWDGLEAFGRNRYARRKDSRTVIQGFEGAFFKIILVEELGRVRPTFNPAVIEVRILELLKPLLQLVTDAEDKLLESLHCDPKASRVCHDLLSLVLHGMLRVEPNCRLQMGDVLSGLTELRKRCLEHADYATLPSPCTCNLEIGRNPANGFGKEKIDRSPWPSSHCSRTTTSPHQATKLPESGGLGPQKPPQGLQSNIYYAKTTPVPLDRLLDANHNKRRASPGGKDDGSRNRKRQAVPKPASDEANCRRFACPFYKNDPARYKNHQICCGPGWPKFHRVKYVTCYSRDLDPL
jgi:serine/threonine protein kinase